MEPKSKNYKKEKKNNGQKQTCKTKTKKAISKITNIKIKEEEKVYGKEKNEQKRNNIIDQYTNLETEFRTENNKFENNMNSFQSMGLDNLFPNFCPVSPIRQPYINDSDD